MSWVVLAVVFGAVMILVSKLTRKRPDETAAGAAATIPDIGAAGGGADGGSESGGDGGGDGG